MRIEVEWFAYLAVERKLLTEAQCQQLRAALGEEAFLVPFGKAIVEKGFAKDMSQIKVIAGEAWEKVDTGVRPPKSVFGTSSGNTPSPVAKGGPTAAPGALPPKPVARDIQWLAALAVQRGLVTADACRGLLPSLPPGADALGFAQLLLDKGLATNFDALQQALDEVDRQANTSAAPPMDIFAGLATTTPAATLGSLPGLGPRPSRAMTRPPMGGMSRVPFAPRPTGAGAEGGDPGFSIGPGGEVIIGGGGPAKDAATGGSGSGGLGGGTGLGGFGGAGSAEAKVGTGLPGTGAGGSGGGTKPPIVDAVKPPPTVRPPSTQPPFPPRPAPLPLAPSQPPAAGAAKGGPTVGEDGKELSLEEIARRALEAKKPLALKTKGDTSPPRQLTESEIALERLAAAAEAAEKAAQKAEEAAAKVAPGGGGSQGTAWSAGGEGGGGGAGGGGGGGGGGHDGGAHGGGGGAAKMKASSAVKVSAEGIKAKLPDFAKLASADDAKLKDVMIQLLLSLNQSGASDLHLSAGARPYWRRNRLIEYLAETPLEAPLCEKLNTALLGSSQAKDFKSGMDLDYALALDETNRFRVNLMVHRDGTKGTYRAVPNKVRTLEELGFKETATIRKLLTYANGLVLVTGPVGSGKTTTLTTLIDIINGERKDHVITVEDPIEYVHKSRLCNITLRQAGLHTNSFRTALKAALRENPDIIVIGEMRDLETIEMAISASETGHLVIGTMHTSDAATTLNRLLDVFPPAQQPQIRAMVSESLKGIICQRLLPTKDGGLALATEILLNNIAVGNLIREAKMTGLQNVLETGKRQGMVLMDNSVFELWEAGKISKEVALNNLVNKQLKQQIENPKKDVPVAAPAKKGLFG